MTPNRNVQLGRLLDAKALETFAVVTFDLLDTVVIRRMGQSSDAFEEAVRRFGPLRSVDGFEVGVREALRQRVLAERAARNLAWEMRGGVEVAHSEIFDILRTRLQIDSADAYRLASLERRADLESWIPDPAAQRVVDAARKAGCRVGLITDTPLPRIEILERLEEMGVLAGFDFVYVSNDWDATKAYGNLWRTVRDREGIGADAEWLHIGDNPDSDVKQAGVSGATGVLWPRIAPWPVDPLRSVRGDMSRFEALHRVKAAVTPLPDRTDAAKSTQLAASAIASAYLAPLLGSLATWLIDAVKGGEAERLLLFSRDGFLVDKLLRLWGHEAIGDRPVQYVHVSRRTLSIAAITELDRAALDRILSGTWAPTGVDIGKRIGLDESVCRTMPGSGLTKVVNDESREALRSWLLSRSDVVLEAIGALRCRAIEYLRPFVAESADLAIFDLGWHGTLQRGFTALFPEVRSTGHYLGLLEPSIWNLSSNAHMRGMVCGGYEETAALNAIKGVVPLVETLFLAPQGTTWDYDSESRPILVSQATSMQAYVSRVAPVQQAALRVLEDLGEQGTRAHIADARDLATSVLHELAWSAPLHVVRYFADFPHMDGIEHEDGGIRLLYSEWQDRPAELEQARMAAWPAGQMRWWSGTDYGDISEDVERLYAGEWG